ELAVRGQQVPASTNEVSQGGKGAAGDDSNLLLRFIVFDPALDHFNVVQAQQPCGLEQESRFLAVAVDQDEVPVGKAQRQWYARQPCPGTDIGHWRSIDMGNQGQAVQDVQVQHLPGIANATEVVGAIPFQQLFQVAQQPLLHPAGQIQTQRL